MCQAYEAEANFVSYLENKYGRCPHGHVRPVFGCSKCGGLSKTDPQTHEEECVYRTHSGPGHDWNKRKDGTSMTVCTCTSKAKHETSVKVKELA